jgi:uncharacterized protein (TIGR03382 family)
MRRLIISTVRAGAIVIALLFAGGSALAEAKLDRDDRVGGGSGRSHPAGIPQGHAYGREFSASHSVPEFGPAAAGALAVLVAGGGVLLARRRRR